jgi:hypothetical protein
MYIEECPRMRELEEITSNRYAFVFSSLIENNTLIHSHIFISKPKSHNLTQSLLFI